MTTNPIHVEQYDWMPRAYRPVWQAMQQFTADRTVDTADEIWLLNHEPVFTQGRNGRAEHLLAPGDIDVVPIDRGGQVTYHGPGQLMAYVMVDLHRTGIGIRSLVRLLEDSVIATLAGFSIEAHGRRDAPGVYTTRGKIAALGLRVSRGRSYHGLALNVDMDLAPFERINPCGFADLAVTQISDFKAINDLDTVATPLAAALTGRLNDARRHTSYSGS